MEPDEQEDPGGERALDVDDRQRVPVDAARLRRTAGRALDALDVPIDAQLAITLIPPDAMAELKARALGSHEPTDVLAFPIDDPREPSPGPLVLGDIVMCPKVARQQARALGRSLEQETDELVVHAILHLLGRDHARASSERAMAREQRRILAGDVR